MPELPEVETITRDLRSKILGAEILGIETDWPKLFKGPNFVTFASEVKGQKITNVARRAKNILISFSGGQTMLIHLKMTGHLLITRDCIKVINNKWQVDKESPLSDPFNQHIHVIWYLSSNLKMALSDLRKFANIMLLNDESLTQKLSFYGPEPLIDDFSIQYLSSICKKTKKEIKKVLLDQTAIAGIGNIYADEILFESGISPLRKADSLSLSETNLLYENIRKVLQLSLSLRGTSISDYRDTEGKKGGYAEVRKVYKKEGQLCPFNCGGKVVRIKVAGRGTYYCMKCQK